MGIETANMAVETNAGVKCPHCQRSLKGRPMPAVRPVDERGCEMNMLGVFLRKGKVAGWRCHYCDGTLEPPTSAADA